MEQFYSEIRLKKPRKSDCDNPDETEAEMKDNDPKNNYKNTTMKSVRGALNQHFKKTHGLDIISNEKFIHANGMFENIQNINKDIGLGLIKSYPPIDDSDLVKIKQYFEANMATAPNAQNLQEITIFFILFCMCHRGRENLRNVKKDMFAVAVDPEDGQRYIYQAIDEADKNHSFNETSASKAEFMRSKVPFIYSIKKKKKSKNFTPMQNKH